MRLYAHVFECRGALTRYLNYIFREDKAESVSNTRDSYIDNDGDNNMCFVIRGRDDVGRFLGFEFRGHYIHGDFRHLSTDDLAYLKAMLWQRTRHVPEASVG